MSLPEEGGSRHVDCRPVIIGAGLAGLSCARKLINEYGLSPSDIVILEANERVGGRILVDEDWIPGYPVDLGGEIVHGYSTRLMNIIEENGWELENLFTWAQGDGGPCPSASGKGHALYYMGKEKRLLNWNSSDESFVEVNRVFRSLCEMEPPAEDISVSEYLLNRGFSSEMMSLASAGFSNTIGGKMDTISLSGQICRERNWEETEGDGDSRLIGSTKLLIDYFTGEKVASCIRTSWPVSRVTHGSHRIRAYKSGTEEVICGTHAAITVPITILRQKDHEGRGIEFDPPLSHEKLHAARSFGMDRMIKILLSFSVVWFDADLHGIICADCPCPEFWFKVLPHDLHDFKNRSCYVTAFFAEPFARNVLAHGEEEAVQICIKQLDEIFDYTESSKPSDYFVDARVFDWGEEPYILGGYSFPLVGGYSLERSSRCLAAPVGDCLFFAGEHTHPLTGCTMQATIETGERAADEIAAAAGLCSSSQFYDDNVHDEDLYVKKPLLSGEDDDYRVSEGEPDLSSLSNLAERSKIHVGTAVMPHLLQEEMYSHLLEQHFNLVVPEHHLKWEPLLVGEKRGCYDFSAVDTIVDYCSQRNMNIKGHTLLWHVTSPTWVSGMGKEQLRDCILEHINTVMRRYVGRIGSWDVANEFLHQDATGTMAYHSPFLKMLGIQCLDDAYITAHKADASAKLIYNDNKVESAESPKGKALHVLAKGMLERGVPLHGIGLQAHFDAAGKGLRRVPTPQSVAR